MLVVDQPATIGALAAVVVQDMGITVGYLPGLSMRRIADLTPGSAKTDAKDAAVIAQAARSMPHTPRAVSTSDEDTAALSMLTGFDLDLARPHAPGPDLHAQDRAPGRRRPCWPRPRAGPSTPEPSWPPTPGSLPLHAAPAHRSAARCVFHGGNKRLKRAIFLSAFASLRSDPVSRAYYQRKRDQGKAPWEAVLALAHRRRILTLHAMIHNGTLYDPQPATKLPAAA